VEPEATKKETRKRSVVKSIVWRFICVVVSVFVSYLLTGKWDIAVAIGTIYNLITMILYYFHERMWNRIAWGIDSSKKNKN
jgi:uncharacterized membrane protein